MSRERRTRVWAPLRMVAVLAAAGYGAWRWWQESRRGSAEAWAAGTDEIR